MLAIECSKPAATKAEMGNRMATNRSITLRPASAIHTAMHTSTLHNTPRKNSSDSESVLFCGRDLEVGLRDRAAIHAGVARQEHQHGEASGTDEVRNAHHRPVAQHFSSADLAVGPGHCQQVVAGEQFGAGHHHQQQAQRKAHPAEHARHGKRQAGIAGHQREIQRPQADECAGQHAEQRGLQERQARLGHADRLDPRGDLLGRIGVESVLFHRAFLLCVSVARAHALPAPRGPEV